MKDYPEEKYFIADKLNDKLPVGHESKFIDPAGYLNVQCFCNQYGKKKQAIYKFNVKRDSTKHSVFILNGGDYFVKFKALNDYSKLECFKITGIQHQSDYDDKIIKVFYTKLNSDCIPGFLNEFIKCVKEYSFLPLRQIYFLEPIKKEDRCKEFL